METPGLLWVTMQLHKGLSLDTFSDWYNNEHGPTRLRLRDPQIFTNGLRYRAADDKEPRFLAAYDVTDLALLETKKYTALREFRSDREAATIGQIDVDRRFYKLLYSKQAEGFRKIDALDTKPGDYIFEAVELDLTEVEGGAEALVDWHKNEHVAKLAKIPGWRRTRLFVRTDVPAGKPGATLTLHDYARDNGRITSSEWKEALRVTEMRAAVFGKHVAHISTRPWELLYMFSPAPRELQALSRLPAGQKWTAPDGKIGTTAGPDASITSIVITDDGLEIPYRLEGNPSPDAPTVAFVNSLLTSYEMWDPLLVILRAQRPDLRILRYDSRGRRAIPSPPKPATLDMLAADLQALLHALRIEKLHALVGVSVGGATTLNFALKYPGSLERFVACDFNAAGSEKNTQAWKDRVAVAEGPGEKEAGKSGIRQLADQTVERWFHPDSLEDEELVQRMTAMIAQNDVEGFKYGCQALWDYDMKPAMGSCKVPGLLVVGEADAKGVLVKAMEGFKDGIGQSGVDLRIIPGAGHLPMFEQPGKAWGAISTFL
jgi:pimeloyl-ACP methyl ester carboxylesterase